MRTHMTWRACVDVYIRQFLRGFRSFSTKIYFFHDHHLMDKEAGRILGILKMTEVLSVTQLKRLTDHKYSCEGSSILEGRLQIFWRWLVEQIPLWWAPNAITLTGLVVNVITSLILCYYSPDAKQDVSYSASILTWILIAQAITVVGLHFYLFKIFFWRSLWLDSFWGPWHSFLGPSFVDPFNVLFISVSIHVCGRNTHLILMLNWVAETVKRNDQPPVICDHYPRIWLSILVKFVIMTSK